MKSKGKILGFSKQAGGGIVGLEDGSTYVFHVNAWQQTFPPILGMIVYFDIENQRLMAFKMDYWALRLRLWLLRKPVSVYAY